MVERGSRQRIISAGEKLFARRRFHEITMDDVCDEAGVGKGTIYRHFKDKDDLLAEIILSGLTELRSRLDERVSQDLPFEERLGRALDEMIDFFSRRRQLFCLLHAEEPRLGFERGERRSHWAKLRTEIIQALVEIIQDGIKSSHIRSDVSPEMVAEHLLGMVRTGMCKLWNPRGTLLPASVLLDLFLRGTGTVQHTG
jgi:AcrR family transcriptional regulator